MCEALLALALNYSSFNIILSSFTPFFPVFSALRVSGHAVLNGGVQHGECSRVNSFCPTFFPLLPPRLHSTMLPLAPSFRRCDVGYIVWKLEGNIVSCTQRTKQNCLERTFRKQEEMDSSDEDILLILLSRAIKKKNQING